MALSDDDFSNIYAYAVLVLAMIHHLKFMNKNLRSKLYLLASSLLDPRKSYIVSFSIASIVQKWV